MSLFSKKYLMVLKPLWLREKIFYKLFFHKKTFASLFESATLEFAPHISLKLNQTDISHKQIAFCGFYELLVSRRLAKLAKLGGLMVDVGANFGYYSCLWAGASINNRVIALEASPKNFSALKLNLIKNKLESQVKLHETAIGKERGYLFFDLGPEEQTGWGGLLAQEQPNAIQVSVVSLDEIFFKSEHEHHEHIDVLKIDTEGADTWVLQGAERLLRSHRIHHIFFEENIVRMIKLGIQPGEAQKLLKECGYKLINLGSGEWYAKL